ncbi:MAG: efflux RND transporter periplasmic adaptor subunit [Ferruginibacter sp.]
MSKSLKWILIIAGLLLVLLVILSKSGAFGKDEGIKVTAEKVLKRNITEIVNASGKVYPVVEVKISPDISGEITELVVKEGDSVKRGQVLARIYADIYSIQRDQAASGVQQSQAQIAQMQAQVANSQAALDALKSNKEQAQRNYNMQKKLYDDKVISLNEFNIADATLKSANANYNAALQGIKGSEATVSSARANALSAQSNLQKANKDLGRTAVVAPMDGVVSLMNVKQGEKVVGNSMMAGTEMLRVADMHKIEVRVDVSENDIPKVKLGDSALIGIDAYSGKKFKGVVTQISSSNNGASTQNSLANTSNDVTNYKVYIRIVPESYADIIVNGTFPFRPGMSASADIQTKTHSNVLSVPINAITTREKNEGKDNTKAKDDNSMANNKSVNTDDDFEIVAFILQKDGTVKKTVVKTDIQDINYIEVVNGLHEGDEVITGPYEVVSKTLAEKQKIKVVDKKELFETKK